MTPFTPVEIDVPEHIGWVACPRCALPFSPGGKALMDEVSGVGCCAGCGVRGLLALAEGGNPLRARSENEWRALGQKYGAEVAAPDA